MKEIILLDGYRTIVDDEDYEWLTAYGLKWTSFINRNGGKRYAVSRGKRETVYMHRAIMDSPIEGVVDHINQDGLDNRRTNLRIVSNTVNLLNNKSVGVCYRPANTQNKYQTTITINRSQISKCFPTYEEAVIWREKTKQNYIKSQPSTIKPSLE